MANEITKLQRTQFSGLDYVNIIEDVKNAIIEHPDFNTNWDNFVDSDAGRMLIELFAWITDQLATRIDWVANENFISTATQKTSIIKLLKLIGYNIGLPKSSKINISCTPESLISSIIPLTVGFSLNNLSFTPYTITANDNTGNSTTYEALSFNEETNEYDYKADIDIDFSNDSNITSLTKVLPFYEGRTYVERFTITSTDNQKYTINKFPVIADSIQIYYNSTLEKLLKVNTFVDYEARTYQNLDGTYNAIPYTINIKDNSSVEIEFAPTELLSATNRRPVYGKNIYVVYRIGGGSKGNISVRTINTTVPVTVGTNKINVTFANGSVGTGGEDEETIDHAMFYGPASIRTAKKTVTAEDYNFILSNYTDMLANNSIGFSTLSTAFYTKYGYYPNPLQVINYILLKKPGYETLVPSQYNDFKWADLRLENRFNEILAFNKGELNNSTTSIWENAIKYTTEEDDLFGDGNIRELNNFIEIPTPEDLKANIYITNGETFTYNEDLAIGYTKIESTEILVDEIIDPTNNADWYYIPDDGIGYMKVVDPTQGDLPKIILEKSCNAEFFSNKDLTGGIESGTDTYVVNLRLDNRQVVPVTFTPSTTYTAQEIADEINEQIATEYNGIDGLLAIKPYAYGYNRINIVTGDGSGVTALWEGEEKVLAPSFNTITTSDTLGLKLRIFYENDTQLDKTFEFTLNPDQLVNPSDGTYEQVEIEITGACTSTGTITITSPDGTSVVNVDVVSGDTVSTVASKIYAQANEFTNWLMEIDVDGVTLIFDSTSYEEVGNFTFNGSTTGVTATVTVTVEGTGQDVLQEFDEEVTPEATDYQSFLDIAVILNRVLNHPNTATNGNVDSHISAVIRTGSEMPGEQDTLGSCYDIFFVPNETDPGTPAVSGIEILEYSNGSRDIAKLLNNNQVSGIPYAKFPADYRSITKVIKTKVGGLDKIFLRIQSPVEDIESSMIQFTSVTNDWYTELFSINYKSTCNGIKRLSLITNQNIGNSRVFGNLIYEINKYYIPIYLSQNSTYSVLTNLGTVESTVSTEKELYISYVYDISNKVLVGNTNEWYTADTVEYIYNTKISDLRIVDPNESDHIIKFNFEPQLLKNSIYVITSDIVVSQVALAIINSDYIEASFPTFTAGDTLNFLIDGVVGDYSDKHILVDLNGVTDTRTLIVALQAAFSDVRLEYGEFDDYFITTDTSVAIKSNMRTEFSNIIFFSDAGGSAAEDLFNITFSGSTVEIGTTGDYYFTFEVNAETNKRDVYLNRVDGVLAFPDGNFYTNYINDRRFEIDYISMDDTIIDEESIESYLYPYKIIGVENTFYKPLFKTFEVEAIITYDKTFNRNNIKSQLENYLYEKYGEITFNKTISKSELFATILDGTVLGIKYATISYFGLDYNNQTEYPTTELLTAEFDEIILLKETQNYLENPISGLIFTYIKA